MSRKRKTAVALSMILCLSASAPAMAEEWKHDSGGWWYEKSDGAYPREGREKIAGTWYYFDGDGYMHSGWLQQGEDWYSMEDITGESAYAYDSLGRLKTATNGSGKVVEYVYDEGGEARREHQYLYLQRQEPGGEASL